MKKIILDFNENNYEDSYLKNLVSDLANKLDYTNPEKDELLEDMFCGDTKHLTLVLNYHFDDLIDIIYERMD